MYRVGTALHFSRKFLFGTRSFRHILFLILGMSIALVPLVVVQEVSTGMIEGIVRRFIETGTYHIRAKRFSDPATESQIIDDLERLDGLQYVTYERQGYALVSSHDHRLVVSVRAVSPELWDEDVNFRRFIELKEGSRDFLSQKDIILGEEVAKNLGVGAGDEVIMLSTKAAQFIPKPVSMRVRGIISTGYRDLDRLWSFVSFDTPHVGGVEYLGIKIEDPFSLPNPFSRSLIPFFSDTNENLLWEIAEILYPHWGIATWYDMEQARYETFHTTFALLRFIMVLILLVASVTISVSLVRVVIEKEYELAILKGLGASSKLIQTTFLLSGAIIGLCAVCGGLILSSLVLLFINDIIYWIESIINMGLQFFSTFIYKEEIPSYALLNAEFYLPIIPIQLRFFSFWIVSTGTILLAVLAAWIPSRRAAKVSPAVLLLHGKV